MNGRIFFKNNPYPAGHRIQNFVWSGRLDEAKGLLFDFHLETQKYYAEDDSEDAEIPTSDWTAKIAWSNFHACTMSSNEWHFGGFVVGTEQKPFDFSSLSGMVFEVDTLPLEDGFDFEKLSFHTYLLGHDSCANHRIVFSRNQENNSFNIHWTGKIALTYADDSNFDYDFEAHINNVQFAGFDLCDKLDIEQNQALLEKCIIDSHLFKLNNRRFEFKAK